jgi:Uma2 family endonuclease
MRQAQRHFSIDEYLSLEEGANVRHEYFDGEIFAMSGGTINHNQIAQNAAALLRNRNCRSYLIDLRVRTASGLYTYPDVVQICGAPAYTSERPPSVTNPVVIAEVLSESTRDYDRGQKFELYRATPTLRDYLLIDQYAVDVEHRFLAGGRWESQRYTSQQDAFRLTAVDLTIQVAALYDLVDFSAPAHD